MLADVHPDNWNLDPSRLGDAAGPAARAVIVSHLHGGLVPMDEVTAFARPKHLGIRLHGRQFTVQVDYRLTPVEAGTRLDYSADVTTNSWLFRALAWLFRGLTRGILRHQMAKLNELAESGR